jgi:hypothetical protein
LSHRLARGPSRDIHMSGNIAFFETTVAGKH